MNQLLSIGYQFFEQRDEQFTAESPFVRCKPEGTFRIDGRCRAHTLPLAGALDDRRFTSRRPGLAMYRISPKSGLVPEEDVRLLLTSLFGNRRIRVVLPAL